jgi:hypothetical protein
MPYDINIRFNDNTEQKFRYVSDYKIKKKILQFKQSRIDTTTMIPFNNIKTVSVTHDFGSVSV